MIKTSTTLRLWKAAGISAVALTAIVSGYALNSQSAPAKAAEEGTVIYSNTFQNETDFTKCTVVAGEDNQTNQLWKYYKYGPNIQYSIYNGYAGEADCYLFIPDVDFNSSKYYTISAEVSNDANKDEFHAVIEFGYATSASISAYTAINEAELTSSSYSEISSQGFSVTGAPTYAVIRAHYPKAENETVGYIGLKLKNLVVKQYNELPETGNGGNGGGNTGGNDNPGAGFDDDEFETGAAKPLPYSIVPTEDELDDITLLDYNNDEDDHGTYVCGVWSYDMEEEALMCLYSLAGDQDDYIFLPLLMFDDSTKAYEVALDVKSAGSNYPETFEVCLSKSKDPEKRRIIYESGKIKNDEWETVTVPMGIDKAGKYYVSIHATTNKNDSFKLYVKNISVKKLDAAPAVPQAPVNVTATAGEKGALNAEISFDIPALNIANQPLSGDVTVLVKSSVDEKSVTAAAGSHASVSLNTIQGNNSITLRASNANGIGNTSSVTVYTGVDVPKAPALKSKVSEDNLSFIINWEMSETGVNGGYVDPSKVVYTIYHYDSDKKDYDDGTQQTGVTTYTFTAEAGTPQRREAFFITAKNVAGQEEGAANSAAGVIGTPYTLPMVENLNRNRETYSPLTTEIPDETYSKYSDFRVYDLATIFETTDRYYEGILDGHSSAIWAFNRYENGKGRYNFPKFSTEGVNETKFKLNAFINEIFPDVDVYVSAYDKAPVKIGTIGKTSGSGWTTMAFTIPETFADCKWVQVSLDTEITDFELQNIFISSYSFSVQMVNDMALENLTGNEDALSIGEESTYTATVRNEGKESASAPSVKFTLFNADGKAIDSKTVPSDAILAPEAMTEYNYTILASADNIGDLTLEAEIVGSDDNNDNNSASLSVSVVRGLKPIVNDLTALANEDDSSVTLNWNKPDIKLTGLDDFESYQPFEYGKYIGNFKNVDLDGKKTYSYDQCVFDAATLPKAFMVINPDYLSNKLVAENYKPHSGSQYLVAFCPADGSKANDWLISPEVKGGTAVIFYITTVALGNYSEDYEICYSTTGNNPSDFKVLEKKTIYGVEWKGEAFVLPEDARYFAIHYVSSDVFGIMLDDIDYTPVINEKSEFKYNVYENDGLIATGLAETTHKLTGVTSFENRYNVTSVVDGIEYAPSNTAVPTLSSVDGPEIPEGRIIADGTSLILIGYQGREASVCTADGRIIFSGRINANIFTIAAAHGIYIVQAGKDVKKISLN